MTELDILDLNDEVLVQTYQGDNYQCFDTGVDSKICYILFSSNGLYYPNTREVFEDIVIKKDRYEWKWVVKNSRIPQKAGRIIYVRDIYKEWYAKGINARDNTIDKTIKLLKKLTEGYRVITVGSSAGGYMAVLVAVMLKAEYCYNFSGQYILSDRNENPYYDLTDIVRLYNGTIFYFFPVRCDSDKEHYDSVKNVECVKAFMFDESKHAATMFAGNMSYIIDATKEDMLKLYEKYNGRKINKFLFLLRTVPFHRVFGIMKKEILDFMIRRMGKQQTGV